MQLSRSKNAIRSVKWGVLNRIVSIFQPFVVRTILIHILSAEYAGLNSLFTSILSILSLSELGFSNAIVYSMYKPIANDEKDKVCAYLNIFKKAYRIVGTVILVAGLIAIPFLPYLIKGNVPADINLYLLYMIYLLNTVISYFLYAYKTSILSAYQREDIISRNTIISNIVLNLLQIVVLIVFKSYYMYAIFIPITTILLNILNSRAVDRMFPDYKPKGDISDKEKRELKKNLSGIMMWKIGGATRNTLDSIVISMYIGLTVVAIYNNYFYVINGMTAFLGVILTSMTAGIGNKIANSSVEDNYKDFNRFHFMYLWLTSWCTVCMLCLYQPFMKLWMGEKLMFSTSIVPLFCYYFFMMKQGDINSVYYQAAGLWWYGKWVSVLEAVMNLILNLVLGYIIGIVGILLATIISYLCANVYGSGIIYRKYFKEHSFWEYWIRNIKFLILTVVVGLLTYIVCEKGASVFRLNTEAHLALNLLICIILPNAIFLIALRRTRLYSESVTYLKSIVKHK
ncbi:MAG: oligosaccharide flippase family protein [Clostridiales bacterium]|nr:oligosaccharide flippase family protein [Clostridiales bacterium]